MTTLPQGTVRHIIALPVIPEGRGKEQGFTALRCLSNLGQYFGQVG